jgi:hypothetical protein
MNRPGRRRIMLGWLDSEKRNSRGEYDWTEGGAPFAKPAKGCGTRLGEAEPQARCCVTRQPRLREKEPEGCSTPKTGEGTLHAAIRPRTGQIVPKCPICQAMFPETY